MRKKIYIAYTGGTIGMKRSSEGYIPEAGYFKELLDKMPELQDERMPEYHLNEYDPLIDSSNITPEYWEQIAEDIYENYNDYDGFLVFHGTDTMAYSASVLSFMLENLGKPVIFTGSQIPLCEIRNDARKNIITSLQIAAEYNIPEVCLYFGNKLYRGCRTVKFSADGFNAFDSPNSPSLGDVGIHINIKSNLVMTNNDGDFKIVKIKENQIGTLRLFPGISVDFIKKILRPPLKALVLEGYGVGNGPVNNQEFISALEEATQRGVVIVASTQCIKGTVDLGGYKTGSRLEKAGVISGYDMTTEAALGKLFYLFSQENMTIQDIKENMKKNLRGELTNNH